MPGTAEHARHISSQPVTSANNGDMHHVRLHTDPAEICDVTDTWVYLLVKKDLNPSLTDITRCGLGVRPSCGFPSICFALLCCTWQLQSNSDLAPGPGRALTPTIAGFCSAASAGKDGGRAPGNTPATASQPSTASHPVVLPGLALLMTRN